MDFKHIIKIGVNVFVIKDEKILFGKRIGKRGYDTWCLPGGHLEYGESMIEGVKRELREETGLEANSVEFAHMINESRDDSHYIHVNFTADVAGEPSIVESDKFAEWKWFDMENLPDPIFIGHQKFIPVFLKKDMFLDS